VKGGGVEVSVMYVDATGTLADGRDVVQALTPIQPIYVFRAYYKWEVISTQKQQAYAQVIPRLKQSVPSITNVGGFFPLEYITRDDHWPNGAPITDQQWSQMPIRDSSGQPIPGPYQGGYTPDPRSQTFQDFTVAWAKEMKQAGVDSIHFDGYAFIMAHIDASLRVQVNQGVETLLERVRSEADVLVTVHSPFIGMIQPDAEYSVLQLPALDFVDGKVWRESIQAPFTPMENYAQEYADMQKVYGKTLPLHVFMDYYGKAANSPLSLFTSLSLTDKQAFLSIQFKNANANGASFVLPVHGGDTSEGWFDSVKIGIYNDIVSLVKGTPVTTTSTHTPTSIISRIPGFPLESIIAGLLIGVSIIFAVRKTKATRPSQKRIMMSCE
jgi:hypothetical protein